MYYKGQIQKCVIMLPNMCILKEDNNDYYLFYTQKLLGSSTSALHIFSCFKLHFDQGGECFHNCCLEDEEIETQGSEGSYPVSRLLRVTGMR